jgi:hypothetical protein
MWFKSWRFGQTRVVRTVESIRSRPDLDWNQSPPDQILLWENDHFRWEWNNGWSFPLNSPQNIPYYEWFFGGAKLMPSFTSPRRVVVGARSATERVFRTTPIYSASL